jgi:hypothetical protein
MIKVSLVISTYNWKEALYLSFVKRFQANTITL